ncbi:hypothetical protein [Nostoc sp. 'Peltigera malacea cyanobiont' DB3992]|uniref:hypothetical protein n=1 Tax=Nostoc sp. 'Peltigera malacea cyanobiont' DB3992 TaxID=1206980 RepID=UPI0027BB00E6|nr:hypothetical protein [Nostoc sp. 'Peltigera malacea cyanobiont' DB3992]
MANRSRKLKPKASKLNQPRAGAMKRVVKKPQKKLKTRKLVVVNASDRNYLK